MFGAVVLPSYGMTEYALIVLVQNHAAYLQVDFHCLGVCPLPPLQQIITSIDQAVQVSPADRIYPSVTLVISKTNLMLEQQALCAFVEFPLSRAMRYHRIFVPLSTAPPFPVKVGLTLEISDIWMQMGKLLYEYS